MQNRLLATYQLEDFGIDGGKFAVRVKAFDHEDALIFAACTFARPHPAPGMYFCYTGTCTREKRHEYYVVMYYGYDC